MSKRQAIIIIGVFVTLFLFLGFPASWDKFLAIAAGALTVVIAYRLKPESRTAGADVSSSMPYAEYKADITNPTPPSAR